MTTLAVTAPPPILTVVEPDRADDELSTEQLGSRIVGMSGRLAAATCRWLLLVAEFDRREGYTRFGLWSTPRWLSHHCGIAQRTAVEHVRVARALAAFPELATEMAAGRLSYSQVRAISRVPREGEQRLVADLIQVAQNGTASQLETMVRGLRTVDAAAEHGERPEEYVRSGWTSTSQWSLAARLDPERGAVVERAISELARAEQITVADALVRIAELTLAALREGDTTVHGLRGDELAAVVVHINADKYPAEAAPRSAERGWEVAAGRLDDGPGLPQEVVERLACAGRVRTIITDENCSPLDVGRSQRLVTKRLYRALLDRDRGCRHPGCISRHGLHAHHVRHWLHGGPTDLGNLILLCAHHHRALHDGRFRIEVIGQGRWRFVRADGRELLAVVLPADFADSPAAIEQDHDTASTAPTTRWYGETLDRRWAISVLAERRVRAG